MNGYTPGLFDRLMAQVPPERTGVTIARLSIEAMTDSVARDLEALLNTRALMRDDLEPRYPHCARSIITYGLNDFAGLSLSSTTDRTHICRCIEAAIERHEPRLRRAKAALEVEQGSINRLNFAITALLVLQSAAEPVNFDAVLQPSSLHYSISKARRPASQGA